MQKAQGLAEYAITISIVLAALMGLQVYLQRSVQAHIKEASDSLGLQENWRQTDPRKGAAIEESRYYNFAGQEQKVTKKSGGAVEVVSKEQTDRSNVFDLDTPWSPRNYIPNNSTIEVVGF